MVVPPAAGIGGAARALQLPSFFGGLPETLREQLRAAGQRSLCPQGRLIHGRGDPGTSFSIVETGAVRFSRTDLDGATIALATIGPGEAFGEISLFAGLPRAFDAYAAEPTVLRVIAASSLDRLFDSHPDLRTHVLRHITRQLVAVTDLLDDERRLPLNVRLAKQLAARAQRGMTTIDVTQVELAEDLAVSRVAVNHAIRSLARQGLVVTGYGRLRIPDLIALDRWVAARSGADIDA